jgi:hypothetical protein
VRPGYRWKQGHWNFPSAALAPPDEVDPVVRRHIQRGIPSPRSPNPRRRRPLLQSPDYGAGTEKRRRAAYKAWATKYAAREAALKREPRSFLEREALDTLQRNPTDTVSLYANRLRLPPDSVRRLRAFLRHHLPPAQVLN